MVVEFNGDAVTATGLYTAPAQEGTYHVRSTQTGSGKLSAEATVSVSAVNPDIVAVLVKPLSAKLRRSETLQFTANVTGTTNSAVSWTATAGTITAQGPYPAPATYQWSN